MIDEKKSGREDLHRFCQSCVIVGCNAKASYPTWTELL
ncbi:hypothetical protein ExPEC_2840 [Escherichia coli]|nr:hypothetical protein J444_0663 [Escherichia coli ACN001]ALY12147.1 hypothetical protein ACN002_0689 [Escherichia coli]EGX25040.1 hypothetical protein ECTX1999_0708 [Escherichia coli TX1999]EHV90733.1 hypothetical protein ECDEC7C_0765 [Escherichia coli DEC7C]EHV95207.1 hypothetical protein ECDEC7D_0930 [Escherichia coli DEC7D]EHW05007.1 hypothetical protein ECDEC7E_0726 [Escherichia coli DEC7E]EMU66707.1 hypothetical protein ECMP02155211_0632 [Escherichia coli MP021552.11]EMU71750.1 hypoth